MSKYGEVDDVLPAEFNVTFSTDPTTYGDINEMAIDIGSPSKQMRDAKWFRKKILQQAGTVYSMVYDTDLRSASFGRKLKLTPERKLAVDKYKRMHETAVLKYSFSHGFTTSYDANGRFVREYRLINWRDREGRVGWGGR